MPCSFAFFWHRELFRTRFAQDIALNCKLQLILVVWGLSRASLGASFRAPEGTVPCSFAFFPHRALFKTRLAQDLASNCKLNLILLLLGLSRALAGLLHSSGLVGWVGWVASLGWVGEGCC